MAKQKSANSKMRFEEVALDQLHDHPDNDYPVDQGELQDLMESIRRDGLAQLPLVRETPDGLQIIAGHRRVECFRRLAKEDPASYSTIPVNVLPDCSDEHALVLLEITNLMVRQLSPTERARRFERLWDTVPALRKASPQLKGVRTSQIIAEMITQETGQAISRATVDRALAAGRRAKEVSELVDQCRSSLSKQWRTEFNKYEGFTPSTVQHVASLSEAKQKQLWADYQRDEMTPRQLNSHLTEERPKSDADAEHALDSVIRTLRNVSAWKAKYGVSIDTYRTDYIKGQLDKLVK